MILNPKCILSYLHQERHVLRTLKYWFCTWKDAKNVAVCRSRGLRSTHRLAYHLPHSCLNSWNLHSHPLGHQAVIFCFPKSTDLHSNSSEMPPPNHSAEEWDKHVPLIKVLYTERKWTASQVGHYLCDIGFFVSYVTDTRNI
jgi:hypothetical protein